MIQYISQAHVISHPQGSTKEMKHYKTLTTSAIYRDGGSLEARFQCADRSFERFPELLVQ